MAATTRSASSAVHPVTSRPAGPRALAGDRGFTLVELVVVIAILGILASIAVTLVTRYLATSQEQAYNADQSRIQEAVRAYYGNPANQRFRGMPQYPIMGALRASGALSQPDANATCAATAVAGAPLAGTRGGKPTWYDDGDGIRSASDEVLRDEDCASGDPGWHSQVVALSGTDYLVDSRDYLVDFDVLTADGYLDRVPESASLDNKRPGSLNTYAGPYSWFVDASGKVESLLFAFPEPDKLGFQGGAPPPAATATPGATPTATATATATPGATPTATATPGSTTRVTSGLVVLYNLDEGTGSQVHDVSQVGAPLDLNIADLGSVTWVSGGLAVNSPTIVASAGAATKVIAAAQATNEITLEVWVKPASVGQSGPARIFTLSQDANFRNFTLGQDGSSYDVRLRTTSTSLNGIPSLPSPPDTVTTALTHVVYTRESATGATRLYVNGVLMATGSAPSTFANWDPAMKLALANEFTLDRTWLGELHLAAVYDRALSAGEVAQNYGAGANPPTTPAPAWRILPDFGGGSVGPGGSLTADRYDVFALEGDSDEEFWRFDLGDRAWVRLEDAPSSVGGGGALAWAGAGYIYALRGGDHDTFWRYAVGADDWSDGAVEDAPQHVGWGGALAWDGGNVLYAVRGDNRKDIWGYSVPADEWTEVSQAPNNIKRGGAMVHALGRLYALRGEDHRDFSRYDVAAGAWTALADTPAAVAGGGSLAWAGGNYIYALRGDGNKTFWRYSISANAWETLPDTPATVGDGGALVFLNGELYVLRGGGSGNFWKFSPYQ